MLSFSSITYSVVLPVPVYLQGRFYGQTLILLNYIVAQKKVHSILDFNVKKVENAVD